MIFFKVKTYSIMSIDWTSAQLETFLKVLKAYFNIMTINIEKSFIPLAVQLNPREVQYEITFGCYPHAANVSRYEAKLLEQLRQAADNNLNGRMTFVKCWDVRL